MNKQTRESMMLPAIALLLLIFAVAGIAGAQEICVPPTAGLISWWPGDGSVDDIINNNPGNAQDGTTYRTGKVRQAFSFEGFDEFVEATDIGLPLGSAPRTLGLWVRPAYNARNSNVPMYDKKCRIKEWTMNPLTGASTLAFTVFKNLRAGTYGVEVVNKVGRVFAIFTVK